MILGGKKGKKDKYRDGGYEKTELLYESPSGAGRWLKIWTGILIVLLIILALSLRISDINVIGNVNYTEEEAIAMVFDDVYDRNPIVCFIENRFFEHKELPFIEDYDIRFHSPFSCDLILYEKSIVGALRYMSSYMYFDRDGIVVENSTELIEGVPEITGLKFGHIVLNRRLPIEDEGIFSEIMNITQQLSVNGIRCDTIDFDPMGEARLILDGGDIEVELGKDEEIDAKILLLSDILPSIRERGLRGALDLSDYSDMDENNDVSLKLREETSIEEEEETKNIENIEETTEISTENT